jgi:hypothetical protein
VFAADRIKGLSVRPDYAAAQSGGPVDPGDPSQVFDFDRPWPGGLGDPTPVDLGSFGDGILTYTGLIEIGCPVLDPPPAGRGLVFAVVFSGPDGCVITGSDFDGDPPDASSFTADRADANWTLPCDTDSTAITSHLRITCT